MTNLPGIVPAANPQPAGVAWPNESWPRAEASAGVRDLVDAAFELEELSSTFAVAVIQGGRLVAERYGGELVHFDRDPEPIHAATPLLSWSMAKSMTHYLVGLLVDEGRLDPAARAAVPEWADPDDPRHEITLADLLAMRDGLDFVEDYVDGQTSHVIEMLFASGQDDTAGFTARRPLAHAPGTVFNYSSGTTNIISRLVADTVGRGDAYRDFIQRRLFDAIHMSSARATFDAAGTFIGSSYVHATATDLAKFGYLYLRGGQWDGHQLVSRAWVDTAQVPLSADPDSNMYYSWQWWVLGDRYGSYVANGYEGQLIVVVPALDAVVVRLGKTPAERYPELRAWRDRLIDALAI